MYNKDHKCHIGKQTPFYKEKRTICWVCYRKQFIRPISKEVFTPPSSPRNTNLN